MEIMNQYMSMCLRMQYNIIIVIHQLGEILCSQIGFGLQW